MNKSNIFANIPKELNEELFENLLKTETLEIEKIVSQGHTSPESGWYNQEKNEWVIVLSGSAILMYEDEVELHLESGDYVNIPAFTKHKVSWSDPDIQTIWIAIFY